jgi:hypothetical protein
LILYCASKPPNKFLSKTGKWTKTKMTTENKTKLTALPIDELRPLGPTKAFYIRHIGKETHVTDLSSYLDVLFSAKGYVTSPEVRTRRS